jgi:hypothetical protein
MATIKQTIALDGGDKVRRDLEAMGKSGEDAFKKVKGASESVKLNGVSDQATRLKAELTQAGDAGAGAFARTEQGAASFASTLGQIALVAGTVGVALGAAFSAATTSLVSAGAKLAGELADTASKLNITTGELQKLRRAADEAGVESKNLERFIGKLDETLAQAGTNGIQTLGKGITQTLGAEGLPRITKFKEAVEGAGDAIQQVFSGAGVNVVRNVGGAIAEVTKQTTILRDGARRTDEALADGGRRITTHYKNGAEQVVEVAGALKKTRTSADEAADSIARITSGRLKASDLFGSDGLERVAKLADEYVKLGSTTSKAQLAQAAFGGEFRDVMPLLEKGGDAIRKIGTSVQDLTKKEISALTDYRDAAATLDKTWGSLGAKIGAIFAPGKTASATWLNDLIVKNQEWLLALIKTKKAQVETFFQNTFGKSPIEFLMEKLLAAGKALQGFWDGVLLPALRRIDAAFSDAAKRINEAFGTDISGTMLEIASAAAAVGVAFAAYQGWLTPVVAGLESLGRAIAAHPVLFAAAAVAGVVFFDDLKRIAPDAYAVVTAGAEKAKEALGNLVKGNWQEAWADFRTAAEQVFAELEKRFPAIATAGTIAFGAIKLAATELRGAFDIVATAINAAFGTKFTGDQVAAAFAVSQLTGQFSTLTLTILLAAEAWQVLTRYITAAQNAVSGFFERMSGQGKNSLGSQVGNIIGAADLQETDAKIAEIRKKIDDVGVAADAVKPKLNAWVDPVRQVETQLDGLAAKIRAVAAAIASLGGVGGGGGSLTDGVNSIVPDDGFASGGYVRGPGGPRSDSILARLSNGEFVVNALATKKWLPLLRAINGFRMPKFDFGIPKFADGGLAMAGIGAGGGAGRTVNVNLMAGGQTFRMMAPEDVADSLVTYATRQQARATGRAPGWNR